MSVLRQRTLAQHSSLGVVQELSRDFAKEINALFYPLLNLN